MVDELVEHCSKLSISNVEDDMVDLDGVDDNSQDDILNLRLVGRVLTTKPLNLDAVRRTLQQVWSLKDGVVIRALGVNLFLFQFFHWKDCEKVLNGRPWSFENKLIVLQEVEKGKQPGDIVLNYSPFWVRMYDLPFGYRSDDKVRTIA